MFRSSFPLQLATNGSAVLLFWLMTTGCFGGDKMMQIERQCHGVVTDVSGESTHVRLNHKNGWRFAEGWKVRGAWHGTTSFYRPDGSIYATYTFKDGKMDGEAVSFYPNGQIAVRTNLKMKTDNIGIASSNTLCFTPDGHPISQDEFQRNFSSLVEQWLLDL